MLRVLHTVPGRNWGGLEHRVIKQAEWLQQQQRPVSVATPAGGATWIRAMSAGLDVIDLPFDGMSVARTALALRRIVRRRAISVVDCHANSDSKAALGCRDLAGLVRTCHVTPSSVLGRLERLKWRYGFDELVCTSRSILAGMQGNIPLEYCRVIGEWAEAAFFEVPALSELPTPPIIEVVMVGMLRPDKAADLALDAFGLLRRRSVPARLTIAGSSTDQHEAYARNLQTRVATTELSGCVQFAGYCDDIPALLAGSQIVIVPSRQEAQSRIAAQAMAAGRPVVAADVGGLPELVQSGRTGSIIPPDDAQALAQAVEDLVNDHATREAYGSAGRAFARQHLEMNAKMQLTLETYERARCRF